MSPKLKPLLLPQLVEERRRRESLQDIELDLTSFEYSQRSSASEAPSPVTPTFSTRGHFRYPSSASSIESPFHGATMESPTLPAGANSKTGPRALPDVLEEPLEREDDSLDLDRIDSLYDCLCDDTHCPHGNSAMVHSSVQLSRDEEFDYDLADGFFSDGESSMIPKMRKRKQESALDELANRFENKFPSVTRRWRTRKGANPLSTFDTRRDNSASLATSSRSSSISNAGRHAPSHSFELQLPPTPNRSNFGSQEDVTLTTSNEIGNVVNDHEEDKGNLATTPLLPPLMLDASAYNKDIAVQSPLQSPSVAVEHDAVFGNGIQIDAVVSPQFPGMPSPPLSTKPSTSSFHHLVNRLVPSSEIPPITIADPNDVWANKLGHANFNIMPEPYFPEVFDVEACRQFRTQWDLARCNYTKHLVRTGEHYGVTSKTYKLTEEKWASVDATWRKNNEIIINNTVENSSEAFATLKHTNLGGADDSNAMTKIPSLNDPRSCGKFPQLGDEDIVGPMVQATAQLRRSPSKKAKLLKFFAEKFPAALAKVG